MALEIKYHFTCLTRYRNKHRSAIREKNRATKNSDFEKAKARAFVELIAYIEDKIEDDIFLFKFKELRTIYENRIKELGQDIQGVNKVIFKENILNYFEFYGVQEQSDGNNKILVFPQGMKEVLAEVLNERNFHEDAILFAKVAKLCRRELFENDITFTGSFSEDCQDILPNIQQLISMILYGPNIRGDLSASQHCKTISQLILHNCKKRQHKIQDPLKRHSHKREPPLPVYLGLNIHTATRSKSIVDTLDTLGMSISYKRVMEIENLLAQNVCEQFKQNDIVCPASLRKGLITVGALDNIDHNPSSTTSSGSLHGTAISIIQHPSINNEGVKQPFKFNTKLLSKEIELPDSYTIVPATSITPHSILVPPAKTTDIAETLSKAFREEKQWLSTANDLIIRNIKKDNNFSWAAYHASQVSNILNPPAIIALLPLFLEKADSPAMIKHGMMLLKNLTEFLNPEQTPILACDCPVYAQAKYIQWRWPEVLGEDKFFVMLGGLHTEKALWNCMGNLLSDSGWTNALIESSVATTGTADSYLKVSHITRTRHAHQVTLLCLSTLKNESFHVLNPKELTFEQWNSEMLKNSTFWFWDFIMRMETTILILIRAHRESNLDLYIESLDELMKLFFILDHPNYSRWGSIHVRNLKSLSNEMKTLLSQAWVVQKTKHRFSTIPLDHAHEQENAKVKGKGGIIGLTENPSALKRWIIAGPEQARLLTEFEDYFIEDLNNDNNFRHHEEVASIQNTFENEVINLTKTFREYGNPFLDIGQDIIVLHTRDCLDELSVKSLKTIENAGKKLYEEYQTNLHKDGKSIHNPITRNKLPLFKKTVKNKTTSSKKIEVLKNDVELFGRLYIANQLREGDPSIFFSHENQLHPPSLSDGGKLRSCKKSDIVGCIQPTVFLNLENNYIECKIFDGAALVHILKPTLVKTFDEYANKIFIPFVNRELKSVNRIDIVWDKYIENSLKESTRQKRGSGVRRKVNPQTKIPDNWYHFLREPKNKTELFEFLNEKTVNHIYEEGKEVCLTHNNNIVSNVKHRKDFMNSDIEEADTRILIHIIHALENNFNKIMVRTVDSDILVILLGHFENLRTKCESIKLVLAFGVGKDYVLFNINETFASIGAEVSASLPFFHALSGCDTTSSFHRKGKKAMWNAWKAFSDVTKVFKFIGDNPFSHLDKDAWQINTLERFIIIVYERTSVLEDINESRYQLFCKKNRSLENLPPTKDALLLHIQRAIYQSGVWTSCLNFNLVAPSPTLFGWKLEDEKLVPIWMTLSEAAKACSELIKCNCKKECRRCKCFKANLPCTDLCTCLCEH
jgi:hypothetical protein